MERKKYIIIILILVVILQGIFIVVLLTSHPKKITKKEPLILSKGKIAIVIDDWGYNQNNLAIINQIKYPMTMSILPNLKYSSIVAKKLHTLGFEIILHLPMEPNEEYRLEKNTLLNSMNETEIIKNINNDLANVGYCKGVSNHMGSKLTSELKSMSAIFKQLKNKNLYFLDSFVSSTSVCKDLAKQLNLKFAKRDIFLDNKNDPRYIMMQIYKLKTKAKIYGQAIGIGHDRRTTLETLKDALPELEKEGYKLVFISELVR